MRTGSRPRALTAVLVTAFVALSARVCLSAPSPTPVRGSAGFEIERHLSRAEAFAQRGRRDDAREEYGVALRLDPANDRARAGLAAVDAPRAATPDLARQEIAMNEAEAAYRDSRLDEADARARLALELGVTGPGADWARELIALVATERYRPEPSLDGEYGNNVRAMYEDGMRLLRANRAERAVERLDRALALAPAHEQIRRMQRRARDVADAGRSEGDLARLAEDARARESAGDRSGAFAQWQAVLRRDPGNRKAAEESSRLRESAERGQSVRGEAAARAVADGDAHEAGGRREAARKSWRAALDLDPESSAAAERLGEKPSVRRRATAAPAPTQAVSGAPAATTATPGATRPDEAQRAYRAAIAHFQNGRYAEARDLFRSALAADASHEQAKEGLRRCEVLLAR